jgi:hypothetical protein
MTKKKTMKISESSRFMMWLAGFLKITYSSAALFQTTRLRIAPELF